MEGISAAWHLGFSLRGLQMKEKDVRFFAIKDIRIYRLYLEKLWEQLML